MRKPLNTGPVRPATPGYRLIVRRVFLLALGCGLIIVWLLHGYDRQRSRRQAESERGPVPALVSSTQEQAIIRRAVALQDQRREIDETVWSRELVALRHGDVIASFWDQLRLNQDKLTVLADLPFAVLRLPAGPATAACEHDITITHFTGAPQQLTQGQWKEVLRGFRDDGFQLVQSEFRHVRFHPPDPGPAQSTVAATLHITNPARQERLIVRGTVEVTWRERSDPSADPVPERIDASSIELLRQGGAPAFRLDFTAPMQTNSASAPDPLIVYDLDADGRTDIILPRQNLFWSMDASGQIQSRLLCQQPAGSVQAAIVADFNYDGHPDLLAVDQDGLLLFEGDVRGRFSGPARRIQFTVAELSNVSALAAGDVDRDGDLDVWLGQDRPPYVDGQMPTPFYNANDGYPAFLLINDGKGGFRDATAEAGLAAKRFRRTSSGTLADLDNDDDLDLVIVSDFAGVDIYLNDGHGRFTDETAAVDEPRAFGKGLAFGDFDLDGGLDFLAAGVNSDTLRRLEALGLEVGIPSEFREMRTRMASGNRLLFKRGEVWRQTPLSEQVSGSGWSSGVTSFDFDNDGDLDLYIANGYISRESARDYESQFWRHDIHVAGSTPNSAVNAYFNTVIGRLEDAGWSRHGFEKNRLFMNQAAGSFLETAFLAGASLEEDCRCVASGDLDGDGRLDLVITTQEAWPQPRQALRVLRNQFEPAANWIGFHVRGSPSGGPIVGAKIDIWTPAGRQARQIVAGHSFRSQHPATAHFGLGTETLVLRVQVSWPNGKLQWLDAPPVNRYHVLTAEPAG